MDLKSENEEVAQAIRNLSDTQIAIICARAAFRIMPLAAIETINPSPYCFMLTIFRGLLTSRALLLSSNNDNLIKNAAIESEAATSELAERLYKEFDFAHHTDQIHLAGSLNLARAAAEATARSIRWAIRSRWYFNIDTNPENYYELTGEKFFIRMTQSDIINIAKKKMTAAEILSQPLWEPEIPEYYKNKLNSLREKMLAANSHWSWWFNWYEDSISGCAIAKDQEREIALINGDIWKNDHSRINEILLKNYKHEHKAISNGHHGFVTRIEELKYGFREFLSNSEEGCHKIGLKVITQLRHMGGGSAIAGFAVVITIISAFIALL